MSEKSSNFTTNFLLKKIITNNTDMNIFQEKLLSMSDSMKRASDRVCQCETVSQLDIDVLRQKMREMYDFLLSADYAETQNEVKQVKEKTVVELSEIPPVIEIEQEAEKVEIEIVEEEKEEIKEIELELETELEQEEIVEQGEEKIEEEKEIKEEPVKEESIVKKEEVKVVEKEIEFDIEPEAPKTSSVLDYLHNNIMKDGETKSSAKKEEYTTLDLFKSQPSIAESFENKTRSDLRTAIGVGEKFMFINDLFSGDLTAYTHFINMLNEASSLEMSMIIIEENRNKRKWLKNSLAYSTLENLVEKRFKK